MMMATAGKSAYIEKAERIGDRLYLYSETGTHRIGFVEGGIVRVSYTVKESFSDREKPGVIARETGIDFSFDVSDDLVEITTDELKIIVDRRNASYRYYTVSGRLLLAQDQCKPRTLEEFESFRLAGGEAAFRKEKIRTADGEKEVIRDAAKIPDGKYYHTRQYFNWADDEALYGLGQHEEGNLNLRGRTVFLHQANRKIVVPLLVSSKGYGILFDQYSPMIFSDNEFGSYVYCEAADEIDDYFIYGQDMAGVIRGYRRLTGKAALLPRWAFGYIQSQERYENAQELTDTVKEFRKRGIGLDCIVLDWLSWPDGQWGQKSFDTVRFADPAGMLQSIHDEHARFMISIWPNMAENCANYAEFKQAEAGKDAAADPLPGGVGENLLLPGSNVYNALNENARKLYWKQVNENLFRYGVDAWWCDSSEPYTPEWMHREKPEPERMYEEFVNQTANHLPAWAANSFALYHARSLYEGQRGESLKTAGDAGTEKRVINLTRSSYTGQQRYGTILWSGDTAASWDTFRKQIAAGLSFCASGLPFWTMDIGAFFVRKGDNWYWQGDYPEGEKDPAFCELYVRWFEWACFLPVFRAHGTDVRREPWAFIFEGKDPEGIASEDKNVFYDALKKTIRLRYSLLPYIYSTAGKAWLEDGSVIRMLAFDYPNDPVARECRTQFMLGENMMICPVVYPQYYTSTGAANDNSGHTCRVYLPRGGWYDYHTRRYYEGGQYIDTETGLDSIPVFVRAGSIIPVTEPLEWAYEGFISDRIEDITFRVFPGTNCEYTLYDDAGDGYRYENGEYRLIRFIWDDSRKTLEHEMIHGNAEISGKIHWE